VYARSDPEDEDDERAMQFTDITCYMDSLYGYVMVLTCDPILASDIVQETYAEALPAARCLREGTNTKVWLFTILRDIWFNHVCRPANAPEITELASEVEEQIAIKHFEGQHAQYAAKGDVERVRAAIQQLLPEHREIILLREYEGLSYIEIATILRCSAGTIMSRLVRARSILRDLLSICRDPLN
jgi:RNA polymerase sigma-70 factor (ECF subfamily)